ncbi:MAG: hypothetical protein HYU97_10475 [Deltaproteobacteria bacterium]|nr:hypothetical protein [Deltaproteobacteria bacterium]
MARPRGIGGGRPPVEGEGVRDKKRTDRPGDKLVEGARVQVDGEALKLTGAAAAAGLARLGAVGVAGVQANPEAAGMTLKSANVPDSPIYAHLAVHVDAATPGLGSKVTLGRGGVFVDPSALIEFAETLVTHGFQGEVAFGKDLTISLARLGIPDNLSTRFFNTGDVIEGVAVGTSEPGRRLVIRLETQNTPLGQDGIVALEGQQSIRVKRRSGGREEIVNIVNGVGAPTNTLYVVAGPYGPTGQFGLYTVIAGTFAPPTSDRAYWDTHAFTTGDELSFTVDASGQVQVMPDSNLAKMIAHGEVDLLQ